jgi:hypothetical protein
VNKFDGLDPTGWVTQMEHYFSLHGITDDLAKIRYGVLYLDHEHWKWWQWRCKSHQGYVAWTQFVAEIYDCFDTDTHSLGHLTKLKQSGTVEAFITAFEKLSFKTKGMFDKKKFQECVISGLKDDPSLSSHESPPDLVGSYSTCQGSSIGCSFPTPQTLFPSAP